MNDDRSDRRIGMCAVAVLILACARGPVAAQQTGATLEEVESLLRSGVDVISLVKEDCIAFDVTDDAVRRLRAAGADDAFIEALRGVCKHLPPPPPTTSERGTGISPGSAAIRSLIVPGLGQFATGRPVVGVAFLAAWGGALGYGLLSKRVTVQCLANVTGTCPSGDIRNQVEERPAIAIGVGAAVAVAIVSALEARAAAGRLATTSGSDGESSLSVEPVLPTSSNAAAGLRFRIRF